MKKAFAFAIVAMLVFSVFVPMKKTHAMDKIDFAIMKMDISKSNIIPVVVELEGRTVVDALTFDGMKPFSNFEIMRTDNHMASFTYNRLKATQRSAIAATRKISSDITIGSSYQYVLNGFYAEMPANKVVELADMPFVKSINYAQPQYPDRTRSRVFLGAEKTWNTVVDPQGRAVNGNGILCGITDSGLDYTHIDFGNQSTPIGTKVVISRDLAYKDKDCMEEDKSYHGTCCSGIVAGDGPANVRTKVKELGIAPKAKLAGFKIGLKESESASLSTDGTIASFEYNVTDKIQVSNNSYGAPSGRSFCEGAQNRAVLAGVCVVASQGNTGTPGQYIPIVSGSMASPVNVIGVGALDDRDSARVNILNSPDETINSKNNMAFLGENGKYFPSPSKQTFAVIDCGWGRADDFKGIDVKGKVALIQRGPSPDLGGQFGPPIAFKDKCINAATAGASAMILYNYTPGAVRGMYFDPSKSETPEMFKFIPSIELFDSSVGMALRDALHKDKSYTLGTPTKDQNSINVAIDVTMTGNLATFTSIGPSFRGYLKPDVSAPGEGIHTCIASTSEDAKGRNDVYTESFGGTSAAGPFVAGCAALVRQARPDWNAFEVKRALMNTAQPLRRYSNDYYIPMIGQGQGRVNANLAATSPILFAPASALIIADGGRTNITDPPEELFDTQVVSTLPSDVVGSRIPVKVTNYSEKQMKVSLSFEVNSANPEQFNVSLTTTELTIPPRSKTGVVGSAWFGLDIDLPPGKVKGYLNDIYVWATDKTTNKKWHIGVCVYNNDPTIQGANSTYVSNFEFENTTITPNGDGDNDSLSVKYEVIGGSVEYGSYYSDYLYNLKLYVIDQNSEKWVLIKKEPFLELGPQSFVWDGKDADGNYILPDGDWSLSMTCQAQFIDYNRRMLVNVEDWPGGMFDLGNTSFSIEKSVVPPLPTLYAYVKPTEPGVGQVFEVGVYVKNATNMKSMQFKIKMPGASDVAQYMGYSKGDFMTKDEPLTLFSSEYDKDKEQITVDVQRPLDGVTGEGWVLNLKFMAKEMNYFDIQFSDVNLSMVNDTMKEVKAKAFFKNAEISIFKDAFDVADFNHDMKVNEEDLKILLDCMGSRDGDGKYNWRCDLNYDLKIDMEDYAIFSKSYSKR